MFIRKNPNKSGLVSVQIIDKSSGKYVNRKRGLEKLEKNLKSGKLTKKQVNNKGYNKPENGRQYKYRY